MDVKTAWYNLECAIEEAKDETGGDFNIRLETVTAGLVILMDYEPREVLAQIEGSTLPTRPLVSWMVYECSRLRDEVDQAKVADLARHWQESNPGQALIPGPGQS